MIITFGILAPWISVNYTWRWVYYITSAIGIFAWFFLIAFVPESRRQRSKAELGEYLASNLIVGSRLLTLPQLVSSSGRSSRARAAQNWTMLPMAAARSGMILASSSMGMNGKRVPVKSSLRPRLHSSRP